jgi:acetyl-CoA acetyltransferase family protein
MVQLFGLTDQYTAEMPLCGEEVMIVDAVRTAIGRGHRERGIHRDRHPNELLGRCFGALFERHDLAPAEVTQVVAGCVEQIGEQSLNVARNAWLQAGLPESVPAFTVDLQCGSGQQAVNVAAAAIASDAARIVVAGGVEHMGRVPMSLEDQLTEVAGTPWPQELRDVHDLVPQGIAAELIAERWEIPRAEMDSLSALSHSRAHAAQENGGFDAEIVPMSGPEADQGIRPESSPEVLAGLRPAFRADGKVTAGNASQISDGASAVLLASRAACQELELEPMARLVDVVAVGTDPRLMLEGPLPATGQLLARNGLQASEIGAFEVNEAFASVLAMWLREFEVDISRVNPKGGAIALGHPLGASGARLVTTLTHEMRERGDQWGLVTMCCRGGLGTGTLVELVS